MTIGDKKSRGNPLGATTQTVADNIEEWRGIRGLTLQELSDKVSEKGWPLNTSTLSKIERGVRRIDVDDLTALAAALEISPSALLEPLDGETLNGAPEEYTAEELSLWAKGQAELGRLEMGDYWQNKAEEIEREIARLDDADADVAKRILDGIPEARWLSEKVADAMRYSERAKFHYTSRLEELGEG